MTAREKGSGKEVVVAVTGASGMVYAVDLLACLKAAEVRTHLVVTSGAKRVLPTELDGGLEALTALATQVHKDSDSGAPIASGSHRFAGMVIVPCSAGTLAKVAHGFTDNLTARAAHVALKERRPLVLVPDVEAGPRGQWQPENEAARCAALEAACVQASVEMLAKYDTYNVAALKRLVASGVKLGFWPKTVMDAMRVATREVIEAESSNELFRKVYGQWKSYLDDQLLWGSINDGAAAQVLLSSRRKS